MNKQKIIISLSLLFGLSSFSQANTNCIPMKEKDIEALITFIEIANHNLIKSSLDKFCYDQTQINKNDDNQPYMFSKSLADLKLFQAKNIDIFKYKSLISQDILSFYLLAKHTQVTDHESVIDGVKEVNKNFNLNIPYSPQPQKQLSSQDRTEILNYLSDSYLKDQSLLLTSDTFGNSPLHYSVLTLESTIFNKIMTSSNFKNLLVKNKTGFTPIHFLFLKKSPFNDSVDTKKSLMNINRFIMDNFKSYQTISLKIKKNENFLLLTELTFFDFIELMKENNLELYNHFKNKSSFKISPFLNSLNNEQKQLLKEKIDTTAEVYLKSNSAN